MILQQHKLDKSKEAKYAIKARYSNNSKRAYKRALSKVLNVQVEYFQFEYFSAFLLSINRKTTLSANEFPMHNQQYRIESFLKNLSRIN